MKVWCKFLKKSSTINTRNLVPEYFGNNRHFQVFLRLINLILTNVKSDSVNFVENTLNPLKCKNKLLPLLSSYVGWNYDPEERMETNRWVTRLYPLLIRNRGNEIGLSLAVAISVSLLCNPKDIELDYNFSIGTEEEIDDNNRTITKIKIYMFNNTYLSLLNKLIEVVRPAGSIIEFIPAQNITSSETIVLTDKYLISKYDYISGKLLQVNDVPIVVQNSWEILIDDFDPESFKWKDFVENTWSEISTKTWHDVEHRLRDFAEGSIPGVSNYETNNKNIKTSKMVLIDGKFYDLNNNYLGKYLDSETGKIMFDSGVESNYFIKDTRIYYYDSNKNKETYTGMYFDVSNPAKVLNTYYKLMDGNIFRGFYMSRDNSCIYHHNNTKPLYQLKNYYIKINEKNTLVWKVYDMKGNLINWHVDIATRHFIKDDEGDDLKENDSKFPFSDTTCIGRKTYLLKPLTDNGVLESTPFYVNKFDDIVDQTGNVILSKKDMYKVSDSTMIGYSQVHNNKRISTFDGTNILQREWSFIKDSDLSNIWKKDEINDYSNVVKENDNRIKVDLSSFTLIEPIREYTGNNHIRFITSDELKKINGVKNSNTNLYDFNIQLFNVDVSADNDKSKYYDGYNASGNLIISLDLPEELNMINLAYIFKNFDINFENENPNDNINPRWNVILNWQPNIENRSIFDTNELPSSIIFFKKGIIEKRTLYWTNKTINIEDKIYDNTTHINTEKQNINNYQDIKE